MNLQRGIDHENLTLGDFPPFLGKIQSTTGNAEALESKGDKATSSWPGLFRKNGLPDTYRPTPKCLLSSAESSQGTCRK
jgi:hypothetical protein